MSDRVGGQLEGWEKRLNKYVPFIDEACNVVFGVTIGRNSNVLAIRHR